MLKFRLWAGVFALLLSLTVAAPMASAQLARVEPVDPANGIPVWYQDKTGLTIDLCLPQNQAEIVWCLILTPLLPLPTR
jgi:hypothetical protein